MSTPPKYNVIPGIDDQANETIKDIYNRMTDVRTILSVPVKEAPLGSIRSHVDIITGVKRYFVRYKGIWIEFYLKGQGARFASVVTISDDLIVSVSNDVILVRTSIAAVTVTLPDPGKIPIGTSYIIKDRDANANLNNITIDTVAGDINGSATLTIKFKSESFTLVSDGSDYFII